MWAEIICGKLTVRVHKSRWFFIKWKAVLCGACRVLSRDLASTPSHRYRVSLIPHQAYPPTTAMTPPEHLLMTSRLPFLRQTLSSFAASPCSFCPIFSKPNAAAPPKTLFVLDSSFNPPTKAHLNIALSSFRDASTGPLEEKCLLLLLATQNADKGYLHLSSPREQVGLTSSRKPQNQPRLRKGSQ